MERSALRQLQTEVFNVFTRLNTKRESMIEKEKKMPIGVERLCLAHEISGLSDGILALGSCIELISKQEVTP